MRPCNLSRRKPFRQNANAAGFVSHQASLHIMQLSHINVTMPTDCEDIARSFYTGLLGLPEIPKPESIRNRGGVWFEAGGLEVHVSGGRTASGK
jgi:hypothetical protein